jgi:nitric oxide reductase NorF protein
MIAMRHNKTIDLFASSHWILLMGIVAALLAAQWHQEALPLMALFVVLVLVVLKARLIVLDFIGLRGSRPLLAGALLAWPVVFVVAALVKVGFGL